jgi:hypothetical protein
MPQTKVWTKVYFLASDRYWTVILNSKNILTCEKNCNMWNKWRSLVFKNIAWSIGLWVLESIFDRIFSIFCARPKLCPPSKSVGIGHQGDFGFLSQMLSVSLTSRWALRHDRDRKNGPMVRQIFQNWIKSCFFLICGWKYYLKCLEMSQRCLLT